MIIVLHFALLAAVALVALATSQATPRSGHTATLAVEPTKEAAPTRPATPRAAPLARSPDRDDAREPDGVPQVDARVAAVLQNAVSNPGPVYTWQDGEHTRRVRLIPSLVAQRSTGIVSSDLVVVDRGTQAIVLRQPRHGSTAGPVFLSESGGGLMVLPGGVLLALDPEWDEGRIDRFFSAGGIKRDRVTRKDFAGNGFFVETDPGFPSLELANALAEKAGVVFAAPNWQRELVPR